RQVVFIQRADFSIVDAVGQSLRGLGDGGELLRPVEPGARADLHLAVLHTNLPAVAIELDLMRVPRAAGWALDDLGKLWLDELGNRFQAHGLVSHRLRF